MATFGVVSLASLLGSSSALGQSTDNQAPTSRTAFDGAKSGTWLFPVERLNQALPRWLRFGGEYRSRIEGADDIKYTTTNDAYLLSRFRFNATIRPADWLTFFGETQYSRIFFNHHVSNVVPYQNTWDIRQAYVQLGSSTEGWADLIVGRQVFAFGVERVIGPSDWLNAGRTFDAMRFDVHQTGYKVSLLASSVVIGVDGAMDHHLQGNNLYGVYGSVKNAIPKATSEPYILWRLAPANAGLPETANRGHLNEITIGLRLAGALPAAFDYEIEMDRQTGSLDANSIRAWAGYWSLGRAFRVVATAPRIFIESNYASGSKNPGGHKRRDIHTSGSQSNQSPHRPRSRRQCSISRQRRYHGGIRLCATLCRPGSEDGLFRERLYLSIRVSDIRFLGRRKCKHNISERRNSKIWKRIKTIE
jgi:hypothetical protein